MKLWVDDVRPAPKGYRWCKTVNSAIQFIETHEALYRHGDVQEPIELIDLDHDAGDCYCGGGDYIRILDWLEFTNRNYTIRIHSMNPVGVQNMRAIIQRNGWKEVF
jgi:hypothetical protein